MQTTEPNATELEDRLIKLRGEVSDKITSIDNLLAHAQQNGRDERIITMLEAAGRANNRTFIGLVLVLLIVLFMSGLTAYKVLETKEELPIVAQVDTGEDKQHFERLSDQIGIATGNTILSVNDNTNARFDEIMAELKRLRQPLPPRPIGTKKKRHTYHRKAGRDANEGRGLNRAPPLNKPITWKGTLDGEPLKFEKFTPPKKSGLPIKETLDYDPKTGTVIKN